jgi:hypothetical protein
MLKGGFVDVGHKFFRIFGRTKMSLLLAFTIVGCNLDRIRSFLAKREWSERRGAEAAVAGEASGGDVGGHRRVKGDAWPPSP